MSYFTSSTYGANAHGSSEYESEALHFDSSFPIGKSTATSQKIVPPVTTLNPYHIRIRKPIRPKHSSRVIGPSSAQVKGKGRFEPTLEITLESFGNETLGAPWFFHCGQHPTPENHDGHP